MEMSWDSLPWGYHWFHHGTGMEVSWTAVRCHGTAMAPWHCHGMPYLDGIAMFDYHGTDTTMASWHCHGIAIEMTWLHGTAMERV